MKKIFPLILVPLLSLFSVSAQITQAEADSIVKKRMCVETKPSTIYAKEEVQTGFEITTAAGEVLELDYPCRVYYVNIIDETNNKYLIVKENNGNLLEINTKNDEILDDLVIWKKITEFPYCLKGTNWKLEGIVDTETDSLKILEPQDCEDCFTFNFKTDSSAFGYSVVNELYLVLGPGMHKFYVMTDALDPGDGLLFNHIMYSTTSYGLDLSKNELKFYYDNRKKYLLFKQKLP